MTAKKILQRAKANLASEHNVVLYPPHLFETADGEGTDYPEDKNEGIICRFCLLGALYILQEEHGGYVDSMDDEMLRAYYALDTARAMDGFDAEEDATPGNYARMMAIYDRAIELA